MGEKKLQHKLNLKTGFFKTEAYMFLLVGDLIKLIPASNNNKDIIMIKSADIKSVSVSRGVPVEIEFRTEKNKYLGTFPRTEDISDIIILYKEFLGEKFYCY